MNKYSIVFEVVVESDGCLMWVSARNMLELGKIDDRLPVGYKLVSIETSRGE